MGVQACGVFDLHKEFRTLSKVGFNDYLPLIQLPSSHPQSVVLALNKAITDALHSKGIVFTWSSLQINYNSSSDPHCDQGNFGPSLIFTLGTFQGGEFGCSNSKKFQLGDQIWVFDPWTSHRSYPYTGTRVSIIIYKHQTLSLAGPDQIDQLMYFGFQSNPHFWKKWSQKCSWHWTYPGPQLGTSQRRLYTFAIPHYSLWG